MGSFSKYEINELRRQFSKSPQISKTFMQLIYDIKDKEENSSSFNYLNGKLNHIYGREEEMEYLKGFLGSGDAIKFCVVTGPGGIGKSKLVYSFIKNESSEDWKMVYISNLYLKNVLSKEEMVFNKNLLLIIDYAANYADDIYELLCMAREKWDPMRNLRIILIEREGLYPEGENYRGEPLSYEERYPEWYRRVVEPKVDKNNPSAYNNNLLYSTEKFYFLELCGLKEKDYYSLIKEYAKVTSPKIVLTQADMDKILLFCNNQSLRGNTRPLFVLFATAALLESPNEDVSAWNIPQMLDYVYKREWNEWKRKIKNNELLIALSKMLVYATIFKRWEEGTAPIDCLKKSRDIIQDYRYGETDGIKMWIRILTGTDCVEDDRIYLPALEPDLLGEYFVLKQQDAWANDREDWEYVIAKEIKDAYDFMRHCIQDFPSGSTRLLLGILEQFCKHKAEFENINESIKGCLRLARYYLYYEDRRDKRNKVISKLISFIDNFRSTQDKRKEENVIITISQYVTKYLIEYLTIEYCCEITRAFFETYLENKDLMKCYARCIRIAIERNLFDRTFPIDEMLFKRNELFESINQENNIIEHLIDETTFVRKLISRHGGSIEYETTLKKVVEKHFQLIDYYYQKHYYQTETQNETKMEESSYNDFEDLSWTTFVWAIPSMVIPIVNAMNSYEKKQMALDFYKKYYAKWVKQNKEKNYSAQWRYKAYMVKYNFSGEFYSIFDDSFTWKMIQE